MFPFSVRYPFVVCLALTENFVHTKIGAGDYLACASTSVFRMFTQKGVELSKAVDFSMHITHL